MALGQDKITISLVRDTLQENTNDLGSLCTSNRINTNSFWKPVSANKVTMNNDNDFFALNDGFNVQSYNSPFALWNAIVNEQTWTYQRPEGGAASRYRLGDFRTYDHNAGPWFDWNFTNTNSAAKNEHRSIENNGSKDLAWIYGNFQAFSWVNSGNQDNAVLGLLMSPAWTGNEHGVYFYRYCSTLDYDSERLNITIPDDLNSYNCQYKFVPVLTTYTQGNNGDCLYFTENNWQGGSFWWPLRCNLFGLYLKNENWTPTPSVSISYTMGDIYFEKTGYDISNLEGDLTITMTPAVNYTVTFGYTIYYDNSSQPVPIYNGGGSFTAGQTTKNVHWSHKDTFTIIADLKEENELQFRIFTTFSYLGYSFSQTDYVTGVMP